MVLRTDQPGDGGGFSLAACDLDGNGASELLVGAPWDSERAGRVYRIGGGTGLSL